MKYPIIMFVFMVCFLLAPYSLSLPSIQSTIASGDQQYEQSVISQVESTYISDTKSGTLDSVLIEHNAASAGTSTYSLVRTDLIPTPGSELFLPSGPPGNLRSADCTGGFFRVGPGGTTSFASSAGTISLWMKYDLPRNLNRRFWGQASNFETRWSGSQQLVLDWGSDGTLTGTKSDWLIDYWYFVAITWNDDANTLAIYWGDENNEPVIDAYSTSWFESVTSQSSQNCIMSSRGSTYPVDGHVDDFRYYSIERDIDEIRSDYRISLTGSEAGLVHYYKFENTLDDSAGTVALVSSGSYSFSQDVFSGDDGWKADHIEVNVRNIEQLYALYGSFESGVPGTSTDWFGDASCYPTGWRARRISLNQADFQRVSYDPTSPSYVVLENEGYDTGTAYRHYNGTTIYWYQLIDNSLLNEEFEFNMKYLYYQGPIGENYQDTFVFGFRILNGSSPIWNWAMDATNITERDVWNEINSVTAEIPEGLSSFEVQAYLSINTTSSYVEIPYDDPDLDNVTNNGRYLTLWIDDISLTALQKPGPTHVDLQVHFSLFGDFTLSGENGTGSTIIDCNYSDTSFMPLSFSTNSTISFEYLVKISKMTRFYNSSFQKSLDTIGVSYEVELGKSPNLFLYTYIKSYSEVGDLGFIVRYPNDWYAPDIEDPFGNNVSDQMNVGLDFVEIPIGDANSVGWWMIRLRGQNYVSSISTQIQRDASWEAENIYRNNDRIRCSASFGYDSQVIDYVSYAEIDWYLPSGAKWWSESVSNISSDTIITNGTTLGPSNATIGEWTVTISWENGSEVAYDYASFELHHRLSVFAQTPNLQVEPNDAFTAAIYIYDQDNGNPILSDAVVIGNWSTHEVHFSPNLAKAWWEADFNSTQIGTGDFVINVSVRIPFYEIGGCSVNINIPSPESLIDITIRATLVGAFSVIALFLVATLARRVYTANTTRKNLELVSLRGRLEDARNLIGVLVIHRSIGLPIYSRIIKGGFQESLLSSFITALSQFRAEFAWDQPKWTAIPITEVITAVQTEVLICAMITVEPVSMRQRDQLESFGKDIGLQYDLENGKIKQMVTNRDLSESIDPVFLSHFDGALLERYVGVKDDLPKHLELLRETMEKMDIDTGVSPEAIIRSMTLQGYGERKSHRIVLEAIDSGYLIPAERIHSVETDTTE
jgi:hypothetical protein